MEVVVVVALGLYHLEPQHLVCLVVFAAEVEAVVLRLTPCAFRQHLRCGRSVLSLDPSRASVAIQRPHLSEDR